ncbi:hypothetical protein [Neorhizobium sp. LjRoot104]|uniref:hypothetical protein n=1 Tax=Neorhizobium sp. LjRoot104 TaxID=3342254 RepID=UPI003ECD629E
MTDESAGSSFDILELHEAHTGGYVLMFKKGSSEVVAPWVWTAGTMWDFVAVAADLDALQEAAKGIDPQKVGLVGMFNMARREIEYQEKAGTRKLGFSLRETRKVSFAIPGGAI